MFKDNVIPLDIYDKLRPNGDSVCRAVLRNGGIANAFIVRLPSEPPFFGMCGLMSNNHVYGSSSIMPHSVIFLEYKGDKSQVIEFMIGYERYTFTSKLMDATFIEIKTADIPGEYGFAAAQISQTQPFIGSDMYIMQLFGGKKPSISQGKLKGKSGHTLEYTSPATFGSSGSMVLNRDGNVVGIHHSGVDMSRLYASSIQSILKEMKPTLQKKYNVGVHLRLFQGQITHFIGSEMTDGLHQMTVETCGYSIKFGLALKSLLPTVATSIIYNLSSGTCCICYHGIYCGNEEKIKGSFFHCSNKTTITLEIDANSHILYFFVNGEQVPHCIVSVPSSVLFAVCANLFTENSSVYVTSVRKLVASTIVKSLSCSKHSWK